MESERPSSASGEFRRRGGDPLFELRRIPSKIVFGKVFTNGQHALRSFAIRNVSTSTLTIKLRANIKVLFQSENDNITDHLIDTFQNGERMVISNTVDAALTSSGNGNGLGGILFDEMLNSTNYCEEISLSIGEERTMFLVFQADTRSVPQSNDTETQYEYQEINGLVFFFAFKVDKSSASSTALIDLNQSFDASASPLLSSLNSASFMSALTRNASIKDQGSPLMSPTPPDYQVRASR